MLPEDRVGPWGVDDGQVLEQLDGGADDVRARPVSRPFHGLAVLQDLQPRGRRGHALLDDASAEERIDERALAGVELPDHDQQEEVIQLRDGPVQGRPVGGCRVHALQCVLQPCQPPALVGDEGSCSVRQQARENTHGWQW